MANIIRIQRVDGKIDLVDISAKWPTIRQQDFDKMCAANRAAGRGEILGFAEGGILSEAAFQKGAAQKVGRGYAVIAAVRGGSLEENDDLNSMKMKGGY